MKGTDVMSLGLLSLLLLGAVGAWAFAAGTSEGHDDRSTGYAVQKSEEEWRAELSAQAFRVLRTGGTERAFTGRYWDHKAEGVYQCGGCGAPLFHSKAKFKSGTGWPSYTAPVSDEAVEKHSDRSYGMVRTEVRCATCGGHLGHVFPDGPPPTGLRYCINSAALSFSAAGSEGQPSVRPSAAQAESEAKEEDAR